MDTFQIRRVPFEKGSFQKLRQDYNSDNSFFVRDGHTYISPMGERDVPDVNIVTKSVSDDRNIVGSLVRHIFFRTFRENHPDIIPLSFYPFRIRSRQKDHDLLGKALKNRKIDVQALEGRISMKKVVEVQFRDIMHDGAHTLGAVINVRYRWSFGSSVSCASLLADGFNLVGLDVLLVEPIPGLQGVLAPDENLIGTIISVTNGHAVVKTNEGEDTHPLSELLPQRSPKNINALLGHFLGDDRVAGIRKAIREVDTSRINAKVYQKDINRVASAISKLDYRNRDSFTFEISNKALNPEQGFNLEAPKFRFDYGPGASSTNASFGLLQHGPYDSLTFKPKTPRVAIVCHNSARDAFTSFLGKLRDGIPETTNFPGGMRGKYRLQDIAFDASHDIVEIESFSGDEYEERVARYLAQSGDDGRRADLVLIQTKDEFKKRPPSENPYYRSKARFMMAGVPTQFVKVDTIRKNDQGLRYTIDSIALQSYAKMGGVPYALSAGNNVDREIVIGVGNSVTLSNPFKGNDQDRVVGITTFFKADGEYLFGSRCREVPYSEYFEELLANLRRSLNEVASTYGWREGDAVRLVFHMFKPMKGIEVEVVAKLVEEYSQYAITFAFVTVSDHHPYVLFNPSQRGKKIRGKIVGEYVPNRMENWVLDNRSCLIQLAGANEMATSYHSFSTPVLVRIHEMSTFLDLHSIAQQVFNFTFLSWRSFKPGRIPVTIDYANQIANKLSNMKKVSGWLPESVNAPDMRRKKWFL